MDARKAAEVLLAIGEPTRMKILDYLVSHGPSNVTDIGEATGVAIVNVSHHLGVLRHAGILNDEKNGRRVVYSFSDICAGADPKGGSPVTILAGSFRVTIDPPAKPAAKKSPKVRATA